MTKLNCINNCENAIVELERTEHLLSLLFEEIDEAVSASISGEAWKMAVCCNRAELSDALITAISKNIAEAKKLINSLVEEGIQ